MYSRKTAYSISHQNTFLQQGGAAACCPQAWAFSFWTVGRRGSAPVGGAWPGSPCCVRNSSTIAQQLGYKVKIFERVFKHYQLCPVFVTFPFDLKVDPDIFSIKNSMRPLQSDSGLNSRIYDKISPTPSFFFSFFFGPAPKIKGQKGN